MLMRRHINIEGKRYAKMFGISPDDPNANTMFVVIVFIFLIIIAMIMRARREGGINVKALGNSILYSSISFAIASVEMSSKFSVKNFSKDQETLQHAADSLSDYIKIGSLWGVGTTLVLGANYGVEGVMDSIAMNSILMVWVYSSYLKSFRYAANKYGLEMPKVDLLNFA